MNVNPLILQLHNVVDCPVVPDIYTGDSDNWIVFTYADERGALYGDDAEQYVSVKLYVSYYCPQSYNYFTDKKNIKSKLIELGFQIESVSSYFENKALEGDEYVRRVLFEVNYTGLDN